MVAMLGAFSFGLYMYQIVGVIPASAPDRQIIPSASLAEMEGVPPSVVNDKRHQEATKALQGARDAAQRYGHNRRQAVKREARLAQLENNRTGHFPAAD